MRIGHDRPSSTLVRQSPLVQGRFSFQDEGAGSSPARPTTPGLSCENARRSSAWIAAASAWATHSGLRTYPSSPVLEGFLVRGSRSAAGRAGCRFRRDGRTAGRRTLAGKLTRPPPRPHRRAWCRLRQRAGLWVPKTCPPQATWMYWWISRPRRSTRRTRTSAAGAGGGTGPCGGAWPSARWGRCWL
jgi:hypothetical protein